MNKTSIITIALLTSTMAFAFDMGNLLKQAESFTTPASSTSNSLTPAKTGLSDSTVTSGLKEALKVGVDYSIKELGKKDGYLNNSSVKIPLPENLAKAETLIRKAGGDKIANDLINSMNSAASQAAPKTASIFIDAVNKMSFEDAQKILAGGDTAASDYFKNSTTDSLKKTISPIVEKSMQDNQVASYYDTVNDFYKSNVKEMVDGSGVMGMAKSFGADAYLPGSSDKSLHDHVTQKAIDGLFKMIATKESEIRKDPVAQTTSLLKQVFGN